MRIFRISQSVEKAILLAAIFLLSQLISIQAAASVKFDPSTVNFSVQLLGIETAYSVLAQFVMPGQQVIVNSTAQLAMQSSDGALKNTSNGWQWSAPQKPGLYPLQVTANGQQMTLNMFVLRPASEVSEGSLLNYRIGDYEQTPRKGLAVYRPPTGFIEVTPENSQTRVAPHFTLAQFLCKQTSDWPKFLVLRTELLLKLEAILARLNLANIQASSFVIMSGYRTPWYNRAIGNRTSSSRHLYGGAADIFIDENPVDGVMDDLNGDGKLNKRDADFLYDLLQSWSTQPWWSAHIGGLAAYGTTSAHGPFVHVDARGYPARWGR